MNSESLQKTYVFTWLPHAEHPILAGQLRQKDENHEFKYEESYLNLESSIALNPFELPLSDGWISTKPGLLLHGCLRDA
jgi:serine/threonine-protein kinase HipA